MSPIPLAPRAAGLLSLNRLPVPRDLLDRVCPVLIGQSPRTNKKEADRREKLGVPIQELIEEIGKHVPERTAVIDCRLAASRAEMPAQKRAAILAMRERLTLRFPPAEKASPTRWCLFNRRDYRIAQNRLCYFIGHVESLGKPDAVVYSECGRSPSSRRVEQ